MKKILGFIILSATLVTCQDPDQSSPPKENALRKVGGAITMEEAERWTSRATQSGSREESSTFTISKAQLQSIVTAMSDYDGIFFYHALEGEAHHVLSVPYKSGQSVWQNDIVVDANADAMIELSTAEHWADEYMAANPEGPWSHFFGRHVFETILSNDAFEKIEIKEAIDDAGQSLLLLYAWSFNDLTDGRTKAQVNVYDMSSPCPPYCP